MRAVRRTASALNTAKYASPNAFLARTFEYRAHPSLSAADGHLHGGVGGAAAGRAQAEQAEARAARQVPRRARCACVWQAEEGEGAGAVAANTLVKGGCGEQHW
jgi:hypothetical protein